MSREPGLSSYRLAVAAAELVRDLAEEGDWGTAAQLIVKVIVHCHCSIAHCRCLLSRSLSLPFIVHWSLVIVHCHCSLSLLIVIARCQGHCHCHCHSLLIDHCHWSLFIVIAHCHCHCSSSRSLSLPFILHILTSAFIYFTLLIRAYLSFRYCVTKVYVSKRFYSPKFQLHQEPRICKSLSQYLCSFLFIWLSICLFVNGRIFKN